MRVSSVVAGPRTIEQASVNNDNTIAPNQAFVDLLRLTGVEIHGGDTRVSATGSVILTGTANTVRTVFFRLVHGVGAGTTLAGGAFSLTNDEAATSLSTFFALNFILLAPPALATDEFALQWSTGANATANINGTDRNVGGADLNVEELSSAAATVGPVASTLVLDSKVATDPQNLLSALGASFANAIDIDENIQVVDISLAGGGAGNVYMLDIIYRLPVDDDDLSFPRLADQLIGIGFGQESVSMVNSSFRWITTFPDATLNFWTEACSGDGAQWITLYMFTPNDDEGPGLLAFREGESDAPVLPKNILRVSSLTPQRGALSQRVRASLGKQRVIVSSDTVRAPRAVKLPSAPTKRNRFEASPRKRS